MQFKKKWEMKQLKFHHCLALRYMEPFKTLLKTCRFTDTVDFT